MQPAAVSGAFASIAHSPPSRFVLRNKWNECCVRFGGNDPGTDVNNKDPALRKRPLLGAVLMWHLRPESGEYVDGYVHNPRNGETYRMKRR